MNIDDFLNHHQLNENPFVAEEARHDPVFDRLSNDSPNHPDFDKIMGQIEHPSTSIVFGEKGSGKTAIRLMIGKRIEKHNLKHPDKQVLLVAYDDLNPVLDRVIQARQRAIGLRKAARISEDKLLESIRLEDHQDAILCLGITKVVNQLLQPATRDDSQASGRPALTGKQIRKIDRKHRIDLAVLASMYDQPQSGTLASRWQQLRRRLKLGFRPPMALTWLLGAVCLAGAGVLTVMHYLRAPETEQPEMWMLLLAGLLAGLTVVVWTGWLWQQFKLRSLCKQITRQTPAVDRSANELHGMLGDIKPRDLNGQVWPIAGKSPTSSRDSRYLLTERFISTIKAFGYTGMIVLIDRVDEPSCVTGIDSRMQSLIWPMFDNKFLQQQDIGLKLLLPLELRHILHRESASFYQEARLDKQNLIDPLTWSGPTLYDLCSNRLNACKAISAETVSLKDLFAEDVTREMIVDALDQMHQPRDAFKFLYAVIQEHCRTVPQEQAEHRIARLTLDTVRRTQAQRVQELHRGLSPS